MLNITAKTQRREKYSFDFQHFGPWRLGGDKIKHYWNNQPLVLIMALAIIFRLLSAIFAKGWGMLDDHFLVIEASQSWVDGQDYNAWLPGSIDNRGPTGHNFFYPGIHFLLFTLMKWLHIFDPQIKMFIIRLLHGAFSLITVYYGYRIVETMDDKRSARLAGILLAIYFFMPWISVRNLVESACLPFLVLGFWTLVKNGNPGKPFVTGVIAGIFFGLATDIRYQSALFPLGVSVILFFQWKWKEFAGLVTGFLCSFLVVQSAIDIFIWGYPFAEFIGYISVNVVDRNSYFTLPWYNYFLTIGGILLPPVSLFMFYGFFRGWKKYFLIFFPALLFFIFHSMFPNKQERFILPFIPFFIMTGSMGYFKFISGSKFWASRRRLLNGCWFFFWTVNIILLTGLTFMYSKRAQVESMYWLSRYPGLKTIVIEDEDGNVPIAPLFYTGQRPKYPEKPAGDSTVYQRVAKMAALPGSSHPQFFLFTGDKNLRGRVAIARSSFPLLVYETTIEPGFIDKMMHRLNPVNKAQHVYIYRNMEFIQTRAE